jgi:hypothetical protein
LWGILGLVWICIAVVFRSRSEDFRSLRISLFAWDYPFALTSQGVLLASGKGDGPFSVALGATDVARKLTALLKSGRQA